MTNSRTLAKRPLITELNRVQRFYTGGLLLDRWQNMPDPRDGSWSEEYLVMTTEYLGHSDRVINHGLSRVRTDNGTIETLRDLIASDEASFLGAAYAGQTSGHSGVMARIGDSTVRLVIQAHPPQAGARRFLKWPFGKTEAWYILDSRTVDGVPPHIYAGFRPGVTRKQWRRLFDQQDIAGMLEAMHRIEVKTGDVILIEAGMPHAMGSGCLFLEIHEPCDYTIRVERNYLGRPITEDQLHYGIGLDAMFDLFDYATFDDEAIRAKILPAPHVVERTQASTRTCVIDYSHTERFMVEAIELSGSCVLSGLDRHSIVITSRGKTRFKWPDGECVVPQGRGVFLPACIETLHLSGQSEVVRAFPFQVD
ncbi:MAG: hypothetical protein EA384_05775 [Spirochaetaceae bacterium]|nr:MAG: hypothetical protein EA384_05775 [Spirochaetaceae bacterium]